MSWAESATLAVLPNAPSLIYPGKNQNQLIKKRDFLLQKLLFYQYIDSITYNLSLKEKLPGKPLPLPHLAPHLTDRCSLNHQGKRINTTIHYSTQSFLNEIIKNHHYSLQFNEIHNAAAIVIDVHTMNILAYVGNTTGSNEHGNDVDVITSPRSTGSILKPFLFAAALEDGELIPTSLIPDIPMFMDGFSPKNYSLTYDGAVPAKRALARSLNIPSVFMLSQYGIDKFHDKLQKLQFSTINNPPDYYGLSLILGGAEATLWDLCRAYGNMAFILNYAVENHYSYPSGGLKELNYINEKMNDRKKLKYTSTPEFYSAASIWFTFEAMLEVNRPENETGWKFFSSAHKIAWKTGTSFGFRDAWAIGVTPDYVVGVWVGNADGEGRPGLVGVLAAAPVLFDIFNNLNPSGWFEKPYDEIITIPVCRQSGYLPSVNCSEKDSVEISDVGLRTKPCPYHKMITLDQSGKHRVNANCSDMGRTFQKSWFILPPAMEYYYKQKNPFYLPLPDFKKGCQDGSVEVMEFLYPNENSKIYIPVDLSGSKGKTIFEVAHRNSNSIIYWHLDDTYIGSTQGIHQLAMNPELGKHVITVVDQDGNSLTRRIEIVSK